MDYITASDLASNCRTHVRGFSKDPGGRCERPRGMANLRKQVNVKDRSRVRVLGHAKPINPASTRVQDPVARRIVERLGKDSPILGEVLQEVMHMRRFGVAVTVDLIDRIMTVVEERARGRHRVIPVKPSPNEKTQGLVTGRRGRFTDVGIIGPVVYYMRIGDRVKIGTSGNLASRLAAINPEELLAVEAGDQEKERLRHKQFADLRTHGEWFRYEGALAEHIESIRRTK